METETKVRELVYRDSTKTTGKKDRTHALKGKNNRIKLFAAGGIAVAAAVVISVIFATGSAQPEIIAQAQPETEATEAASETETQSITTTEQITDERTLREEAFEQASFTSDGDSFGGLDTSAPAYSKNANLEVMSTDEPEEVLAAGVAETQSNTEEQDTAEQDDTVTNQDDSAESTPEAEDDTVLAEQSDRRVINDESEFTYKLNDKFIIDIDKDEREVLEKIVEAEASGQNVYGKMLVAAVILNRKNNKSFPDTISGVVYQHSGDTYQFAPIRDGSFEKAKPSDMTKEAVGRVLEGEDYSEGALYFFHRAGTTKEKASWFDKKLKYLFKYGSHEFYKQK